MLETLSYSWLCLILGASLTRPFLAPENRLFAYSMALSVGIALSIIVGLAYAALSFPYQSAPVASTLIGLTICSTLISLYHTRPHWGELGYICGCGLLLTASISLFHYYNLTSFSPDSFSFIKNSIDFMDQHTLEPILNDSSAFYKILHSFALLLDIPYFASLTPTVGLFLLLTCGIFCNQLLRPSILSLTYRLLLVVLIIGFFLLTLHTQAQFFYANNHLFAASYFSFATMLCYTANQKAQTRELYLAALLLGMFSFTRIEANLYGVLLLTLFLSLKHIPNAARIRSCLIYGSTALWIPLTLGLESGGMYGKTPLLILAFAPFVCAGLYALINVPLFNAIHTHFLLLLAGGFTLAYSIAFLTSWNHMWESTSHFLHNLFIDGLWGSFWWIYVVSIILAFSVRPWKDPLTMRIGLVLLYCLLLTLLMSYLRAPYRLGWTDSGNRIIFHIAPLALFWFAGLITTLDKKSTK